MGWRQHTTVRPCTEAKVLVVEPQIFHGPPHFSAVGGTCVNVGCVPKKLLVQAANFYHNFQDAKGFGWNFPAFPKLEWGSLMQKKDKTIRSINESYIEMFKDAKMDLVQGWGALGRDGKSVYITEDIDQRNEQSAIEHTVKSEHILLSCGGWPIKPAIPGIEHVVTSNEVFYLSEQPNRVLIIGGGYIAVEFASILHGLGVPNIILLYRGELFLRGFDVDCRQELKAQLSKCPGVEIHFNEQATAIQSTSGKKCVFTNKGNIFRYLDLIICATGRQPRTAALGLQEAGVHIAKNGAVNVNEFSQTSLANVWAVGDITDRVNLTPVAIHEGFRVAGNMFGNSQVPVDHTNIPSAVFSIPPIATVGILEENAASKFSRVAVYKTRFTPMMHQLTGASHKAVLMKLVSDYDTGLVVGVHLLGSDTPEMIQGVAVAVRLGAKVKDFYNTIGVHPTSSEELCSMRVPAYYYIDGKRSENAPQT